MVRINASPLSSASLGQLSGGHPEPSEGSRLALPTPANDIAARKMDASPAPRPPRIVLAGGRGQVGAMLTRYFLTRHASVSILSRTQFAAASRVVLWDGEGLGEWTQVLDGADVLINLVGRSVNCRYNEANRREILESRIRSTRLLGRAISTLDQPPRLWLNASTATIYRHSMDRAMDELSGEIGGREANARAEWKFSIDVATSWEKAFFETDTPRTRKIALRSAMTMSPDPGGVFDLLLRLVRFGLGGAAGSGDQYVSWIHEDDFTRALDLLIAHEEIEGVVNVAAPEPLPNRDFMRALRDAWGIRLGLPASQWMLEAGAVLLRTETELILKSRRVVPSRLLAAGFAFQFPSWPAAAQNLVHRWRQASAT